MSRSTTNDSYQWVKFFEHWGLTGAALVAGLATQAVFFLANLEGSVWIGFVATGFILQIIGGGMIGFAKLPAYRQGKLLTWGGQSVPEKLRGVYRWGWRAFALGVIVVGLLSLASFRVR